ncbi:MAG TPA: GUN4 domain-containing protein [Leptolyngbyaceae cyanobacterium]
MVSGASLATNTQVKAVIQITEPNLDPQERAAEVQRLYSELQSLSELQGIRISFLDRVTDEGTVQFGLRLGLRGEYVRITLEELCDRIEANPTEILLTLYIDTMTLQVKTRDWEELAATIQAAELLVPPRRTFLAKAEHYARSYSEFTPVEVANLELLRQQLSIPEEEADLLIARAVGPLRSLPEKRRRYREVLVEELGRQFPLSEGSRTTLKEYAANLKLPAEEEIALYEAEIQKIQAEAEARRKQQQSETEKTLIQVKTDLETKLQQKEAADRQSFLENYRKEYRTAIATTPYPLQYDQGRLEQARRIWNLSPEEVSAIELAETASLYGDVRSAVGVDYTRLREVLWQQEWAEADRETERALLKAFNLNQQSGPPAQPLDDVRIIDRETLVQLPRQDLITIDRLWNLHSKNHFGFTVQAQIYEDLGRQPREFLNTVGWPVGVGLGNARLFRATRPYSELQFNLDAPPGHLPTWRWCCASLEGGYSIDEAFVEAFFIHLIEMCHILQ